MLIDFERDELRGTEDARDGYDPQQDIELPSWVGKAIVPMKVLGQASGRDWTLFNGDSNEVMAAIPDNSVDLSVYSPPFASLYTYSPTERDLGNSDTPEQFWAHFQYISDHMLRVMKPGRNMCVHVQQLATTMGVHGYIGLIDFRGQTIAHFQKCGFIYYGEVCVAKNPQAQAIRTHSKALLFNQFRKDSAWSRPALADYILIFKKPGEIEVPVRPSLTNEDWIELANPVWWTISESDTLNVAAGREVADERHIAALQLETIARCIKLWSNPGEVVFSPFGGIGSEAYTSVREGRKGFSIELKPSYWKTSIKNLERIERETKVTDLFSWAESQSNIESTTPTPSNKNVSSGSEFWYDTFVRPDDLEAENEALKAEIAALKSQNGK